MSGLGRDNGLHIMVVDYDGKNILLAKATQGLNGGFLCLFQFLTVHGAGSVKDNGQVHCRPESSLSRLEGVKSDFYNNILSFVCGKKTPVGFHPAFYKGINAGHGQRNGKTK